MTTTSDTQSWLLNFRRTLTYLRPHSRQLIVGLLMAFGVGAFYTFTISSAIPLLKVIFADHETLADWLHRAESERRLGVAISADLPDNPSGLEIEKVAVTSRSAKIIHDGERIVGIGGQPMSSYHLMRVISQHPHRELSDVEVNSNVGEPRTVTLHLRSYRWWSGAIEWAASLLPRGKTAEDRLRTLALVVSVLLVMGVFGGACRFANEGLVAVAVQRAMHDLRAGLATHVLRLPMHWHASQPHGDTLGRFANDIGKVEVAMSTLFGKTFREPLKAVGVLALTLIIDWRLLLVALAGVPIGAIIIGVFGRIVGKSQKRASQSWGRLLDHLGERLAGIRVVKAYGMEREEGAKFEQEDRTLTRAQTHIELADAATNPALEIMAMFAVAGFMLYGGVRVFNHELEPHLFFAALICLGGVFDPVRKLGNVNNRLHAGDAAARRLFELLDLPVEEPSRSTGAAPALRGFSDRIDFEGVWFAYPGKPERPVLRDVNLTVNKGEMVALVGGNGSGKTTLISLLLRFYEQQRGVIRIDGVDARAIPLESLRRQIGLVTQDAVVFSDSVRANIAYGANGVSDDVIRNAARQAHIEDFIDELHTDELGRQARGFDAHITARTLSGGQRQRIAIARAILRDPPILILDEATSQVDTESERKIQEAMEDVTRGRTTIIIAHRFSTIARADRIIVLDAGRVVANGRHEELLATSPFYVALCETQFAAGGAADTAAAR